MIFFCLGICTFLCDCCRSEVGTVFCLSWLITWFGHVLGDLDSIVRLYDFFMASDPLMPIYMAASVSIIVKCHLKIISDLSNAHSLRNHDSKLIKPFNS